METCKQCGKEKPNREFPWSKQRVCHDCHIWNAMHWNEIPWPDQKRKRNLSEQQKARLKQNAASARNAKAMRSTKTKTQEAWRNDVDLTLN